MYCSRRIALTVLTLTLAACGSAPAAPTVGTLTAFTAVCDDGNKGKRVAVAGYLRLPDSFSGRSTARGYAA